MKGYFLGALIGLCLWCILILAGATLYSHVTAAPSPQAPLVIKNKGPNVPLTEEEFAALQKALREKRPVVVEPDYSDDDYPLETSSSP